jgi:hypothetical protein
MDVAGIYNWPVIRKAFSRQCVAAATACAAPQTKAGGGGGSRT